MHGLVLLKERGWVGKHNRKKQHAKMCQLNTSWAASCQGTTPAVPIPCQCACRLSSIIHSKTCNKIIWLAGKSLPLSQEK